MKWGELRHTRWRLGWCGLLIVSMLGCSGELREGGPAFGAGGTSASATGGSAGDGGRAVGGGGSGGAADGTPGSGGNAGDSGTAGTGGLPSSGGSGGNVIEPPPGTMPMFVAQGEAGRTLISCDDGRSWVADRSDYGGNYCQDTDCDHHSGAGRGVVWAEGWFFAAFGWGAPGSVRRSRNGVDWESVLDGEVFGGISYGNGRLLGAHKYAQYSDDLGETWVDPGTASIEGRNVRATAFVPYSGGRFVIAASSSSGTELVTSSNGVSWDAPDSLPTECAAGVRLPGRIIYGNGIIVTVGDDGVVCRSANGGTTWTSTSISNRLRGGGVWNGSEFMTWDRGTLFRSTDGASWTETDTVPSHIDVGVVAMSDEGTFASITAGYRQEYDGQLAYRSEDGIHWDVLTDDAFSQGHPMRAMTFGYGVPSAACP